MAYMDRLPDEVLLFIFKNLDLPDILVSRMCCTRWNNILNDNSLYRNVKIDKNIRDMSIVPSFLETNGSGITSLQLSGVKVMENLVPTLPKCMNVRQLTIENCDFGSTTGRCYEAELLRAISIFPQLRELTVKSSKCFTALNTLAGVIYDLPLDKIDFFNQSGYISNDVFSLMRVNVLKLKCIRLGIQGGLPSFCARNAENLTSLKILVNCWTCIESDVTIFSSLAQCPNLKEITIGYKLLIYASNEGLMRLQNLKLETFVIHGADMITDLGFAEFFVGQPHLKKVGLMSCHLVGTETFTAMSLNCKELRTFKFSQAVGHHMFDAGDLRTLSHITGLQVLRLRKVNLELMKVVQALPLLMKNLNDIEFSCERFPISERTAFVTQLMNRLPDYKVLVMNIPHLLVFAVRCVLLTKYSDKKSYAIGGISGH